MILFHGTSEENARKIEKEGFKTGLQHNWEVKSKAGFVYFSTAYAPFYAMACKNKKGCKMALIKVQVAEEDLYPEEDFIFHVLKHPTFTENDLRGIDLKKNKFAWKESLKYLGNVATTPDKIKILGVRYFDGKRLMNKCDPVISPINFKILGDYYAGLTEWIYEGNKVEDYKSENLYFLERSKVVAVIG